MNNSIKKVVIICSFFLVFLTACLSFYTYSFNLFFPREYRPLIYQKSKKFKLPPLLVSAIIYTESRFNETAKSNRGALGLMQLMPATSQEIAKKLKIKNFNPEQLSQPDINLLFGCFYFTKLKKTFNNDIQATLISYNAGKTNLRRWQKECLEKNDSLDNILNYCFAETKNYVLSVQKIYNFLALFDSVIKKIHLESFFYE